MIGPAERGCRLELQPGGFNRRIISGALALSGSAAGRAPERGQRGGSVTGERLSLTQSLERQVRRRIHLGVQLKKRQCIRQPAPDREHVREDVELADAVVERPGWVVRSVR